MQRSTVSFACALASANLAAGMSSDIVISELPTVRSQWNNISKVSPKPTNLSQLQTFGSNRQEPDETVAPTTTTTRSFTDDMVYTLPVDYVGDEWHNPHSEEAASDDAFMMLDIPDDTTRKAKRKDRAHLNSQTSEKGSGTPLRGQMGFRNPQNGKQAFDVFAQVSSSQTEEKTHTCSYAHDRAKAPLDDFYGQTGLYVDEDFIPDDALYWQDFFSQNYGTMATLEPRITWHRLALEFPDNLLWGTNGINPMDVRQGAVGNCWFMAAASALAEKPRRLEKVFLNDSAGELSPHGIYGVNLYTLGVPHTVIVDDYIPLQQYLNGGPYTTIFSLVAEDSALWGPILEKAFAKYHGNYENLAAGDPRAATRTLNGSPSMQYTHGASSSTLEFIWDTLYEADQTDEMLFLITPGTSDAMVNSCGLT